MLTIVSLLLLTNQSKFMPMRPEDVIDVWRSNFYNATGEQHFLEFKADGTFSAPDYRGTWKIVDNQLVMTGSRGAGGRPLRFTRNGDHLTDNVPDGTNYDRWTTLQVEKNFPGLWSSRPNPQAGPPTDTTFFTEENKYQLGARKGKLRIYRGRVLFTHLKGTNVELWPSKDFNTFAEKKQGGFTLSRLPTKPLDKAVLGKWIYWAGANRDKRVNVMFNANGTYTYGKTQGKWAVDGDHIMIENFNGGIIQFLPLPSNGLSMRTEKYGGTIFWRI